MIMCAVQDCYRSCSIQHTLCGAHWRLLSKSTKKWYHSAWQALHTRLMQYPACSAKQLLVAATDFETAKRATVLEAETQHTSIERIG